MTKGNAPQDQSKAFLHRLVTSIRMGHRLDDPRNVEVLERWVAICKGLPDNALLEVIPKTLRGLLRQPELLPTLTGPCGISPGHPMQHESIAPYIISYRRYQKSRGHDPKDEQARRAIEGLRSELRALREQFNSVFDQMAGLEQERERLASENESLQQQVLAEKLRGDEAERRLEAARDKAFRLFRLYLFMLKEERGRLSNDPNRERLLTAEIAVETHAATLEALGAEGEAEDQARDILGEALFEEYFHGEVSDDPLVSRGPSTEALRMAQRPAPGEKPKAPSRPAAPRPAASRPAAPRAAASMSAADMARPAKAAPQQGASQQDNPNKAAQAAGTAPKATVKTTVRPVSKPPQAPAAGQGQGQRPPPQSPVRQGPAPQGQTQQNRGPQTRDPQGAGPQRPKKTVGAMARSGNGPGSTESGSATAASSHHKVSVSVKNSGVRMVRTTKIDTPADEG